MESILICFVFCSTNSAPMPALKADSPGGVHACMHIHTGRRLSLPSFLSWKQCFLALLSTALLCSLSEAPSGPVLQPGRTLCPSCSGTTMICFPLPYVNIHFISNVSLLQSTDIYISDIGDFNYLQ